MNKRFMLALSTVTCLAGMVEAGHIRDAILDAKRVNEVKVSSRDPLTLVLPFALGSSSVKGGDITSDPKQLPASYFINYTQGGKVVDLRALASHQAEPLPPTHINIVNERNEVFVLKLVHSESENDSVVTFRGKGDIEEAAAGDYTPQGMAAYLERTFTYPFLRKAESPLIDHSNEIGFNQQQDFANRVKLTLKSIVKWEDPHPNMLVFNGTLENPTDKSIYYDRHSFAVLIGRTKMTPAIAHCSGVIPENASVPFQFALTRKDYPDLLAISLQDNTINFALTFEETRMVDNTLLPPLPKELPVTPTK